MYRIDGTTWDRGWRSSGRLRRRRSHAAALDFQERHDRAWDEQEDEAELLAKAIGPRYYGEDELRECGQDTGGEQSTEKLRNDDGVLLFIARRRACGVDSTRANSPRRYWRVTARESGEIRSAVISAWRRRQAERWRRFLKKLQNCHCVHFSNYSQIF